MSTIPKISIKGLRITVPLAITHTNGAGIKVDSADPTPNLANQIDIEDVQVWFMNDGMYFRNIQGGRLNHCTVTTGKGSGYIFRGFATLFTADSCWASGFQGNGWDISGWSYSSARGCGSDSNKGYGWYVAPATNSTALSANNTFVIGSEQSSNLCYFDTLYANNISVFGMGGSSTSNGIAMKGCVNTIITPYIENSPLSTGTNFLALGGNSYNTILGGSLGYFGASGNGQYGGVTNGYGNSDMTSFTLLNVSGGATNAGGVTDIKSQVANFVGDIHVGGKGYFVNGIDIAINKLGMTNLSTGIDTYLWLVDNNGSNVVTGMSFDFIKKYTGPMARIVASNDSYLTDGGDFGIIVYEHTNVTHSFTFDRLGAFTSPSNIVASAMSIATNGFYLPTQTTPPPGDASGGLLWNSNKVLYWITNTKTNLVSDGR